MTLRQRRSRKGRLGRVAVRRVGSTPVSSDHHDAAPSLAEAVLAASGVSVARCYQCGKCSAGCPMASEMSLRPHEMLRLAQLDRRERLFADPSMWLCLTCETCTARCPNQVDTARVIDALREIALREEAPGISTRLRAFHRSFLDQVRAYGRVYELGLMVSYKLRTGALFDDAALAPASLARGKLKLLPTRIRGAEEVARIFAACEEGPES